MFALINCLTYFRMRLHNNRKNAPVAANKETMQQKRRRFIEKSFIQQVKTSIYLFVKDDQIYPIKLLQVTTQSLVYVMELVTYFYIADFFPVDNANVEHDPNRWPNFLLTTFAWILVHALDG